MSTESVTDSGGIEHLAKRPKGKDAAGAPQTPEMSNLAEVPTETSGDQVRRRPLEGGGGTEQKSAIVDNKLTDEEERLRRLGHGRVWMAQGAAVTPTDTAETALDQPLPLKNKLLIAAVIGATVMLMAIFVVLIFGLASNWTFKFDD